MKTSIVAAVLFSIALDVHAQSAGSAATQGLSSVQTQDTPFAIVENDANSRVWERTTYEQLPSGDWVPHIHRYQEVATGLNFKNPDTGQWEESSETIEPIAGGATARHGQHKIIFSADIATFGAIDMETPDGQRLQSHLLGLGYYDRASGKSVFIAEITNSIGQLISTNQVWYDNAFTGLKAGVRYDYTREGFEQDVILEERPPVPEAYGLNSSTTVLQAFTEFISPPTPLISTILDTAGSGSQLTDETLSFNTMKIGRGRAFLMGNDSEGAPVTKEWVTLEGRQFLIEEVPIPQIAADLDTLPPSQGAAIRTSNSVLNVVSARRLVPPQPLAKAGTNGMSIASVPRAASGFVLDYASLNTSQTNYTFQADTTYYLSGDVNLYGTNTTFEGGTVIKYASGVSLTLSTPLTWQSGPYRPVIMVAKDDDSVGNSISGSTSNPGTNYYASRALCFDGTSALTNLNIDNLRINNANTALVINGQSNHVVKNLQIAICGNGIAATNTDLKLQNALFDRVLTNFTGSNATARVEHLTSGTATWLNQNIGANLFLTNCLLAGIVNLGSCSTQNVAVLSSTTGIFLTAGAGNYYLATNSVYRNAGTTNIAPSLLASLTKKTTYPPIIYSNITISINTILSPQAGRDTDIPDLGYHYDPIDYVADFFWITNSTLLVTNGAVIAGYNDQDLMITDGSSIVSIGTPLVPNWFTRYSSVQEQPIGLGIGGAGLFPGSANVVNSYHSTINAPTGLFLFTKFTCPAGGGNHLGHSNGNAYSNLLVQDCEFWSGNNDFSGNNSTRAALNNNLFVRAAENTASASYTNNFLAISNNLFWNTSFIIRPLGNSNTWFFFNNDFDNCVFSFGSNPQLPVNGYNAYLGNTNRISPPSVNDIVSTNRIAYQNGPLGNFYQPTNSVLINMGSVTADLNSLYHFTTTTNQVKETNSVVDIGYHYVALDNVGNAVDTDGDGIPDYLEDLNGNGVVDIGESSWLLNLYNGLSFSSGFQVFTPLK